MPIVLDPSAIPEPTLREMARELQEELEEILGSIEDRGTPRDPLGVLTAADLLRAAIRLGHETQGAAVPLTVAVVNVQYETLIASVDLIKSHFGLPTVPRARAPPREGTSA